MRQARSGFRLIPRLRRSPLRSGTCSLAGPAPQDHSAPQYSMGKLEICLCARWDDSYVLPALTLTSRAVHRRTTLHLSPKFVRSQYRRERVTTSLRHLSALIPMLISERPLTKPTLMQSMYSSVSTALVRLHHSSKH